MSDTFDVDALVDLAIHIPVGDPPWLRGDGELTRRLVNAACEAATA